MRGGWASKVALLCCVSLSFFSAYALLVETTGCRVCSGMRSMKTKSYLQGAWQARETGSTAREGGGRGGRRRKLTGPGSSPPRCASKCGSCTPCRPVHVPVPPGTPVTSEYYPEAWRCKCGDRLYMP